MKHLRGGLFEARPDLLELVDDLAKWPPAGCANLVRSLVRRLDPVVQYAIGSDLLDEPDVAGAAATRVEWRTVPPGAVDAIERFAGLMPVGAAAHLFYATARRLPLDIQRALAGELLAVLGPALSMRDRGSVPIGRRP